MSICFKICCCSALFPILWGSPFTAVSKLLWLFPEAVLGVPVLRRHRWRQDIGHEAFPEQGVAPRRDVCSVSDVPGLPGELL